MKKYTFIQCNETLLTDTGLYVPGGSIFSATPNYDVPNLLCKVDLKSYVDQDAFISNKYAPVWFIRSEQFPRTVSSVEYSITPEQASDNAVLGAIFIGETIKALAIAFDLTADDFEVVTIEKEE